MASVANQLAVYEVVADAIGGFCDDITMMFQADASCTTLGWEQGGLSILRGFFKKVCAIHTVKAEGRLSGPFFLLIDHTGLFVLSGITTMLPRDKTMQLAKIGTDQDAKSLSDALAEVGNLMVGALDRILRKELTGHGHLVKVDTLVAPSDQDPQTLLNLAHDDPFQIGRFQMTIDGYPEFDLAVIIPAQTLQPPQPADEDAQPADDKLAPVEQPKAQHEADTALPSAQPIHTGPAGLSNRQVDQVMSRQVHWVEPDQDVQHVLQIMQSNDVGYVLVGRSGRLEGLVSRSGIMAAISPYLRPVFARWRRPQDDATLKIRIKWFASKPVRAVYSNASLVDAARLMLQFGIRCLPVLDQKDQVIGILTIYDLLRSLDSSLEQIRPPQAPGMTI